MFTPKKIIRSQKGISIIGAIFTLIILGIFGATIVVMVSAEHETRANQLSQDWSFYNAQAALEFALWEIDQGGYPLVTEKGFGQGNFTTEIDYDEAGTRDLRVIGKVAAVQKKYQITYDFFEADCTLIDDSSPTLSGGSSNQLEGIEYRKTCNEGINVDKILLAWSPDSNEKVTSITINTNVVYKDGLGNPSGVVTDIVDTLITTTAAVPIDQILFSGNMSGKEMTLRFIMTDSTTETVTFDLP